MIEIVTYGTNEISGNRGKSCSNGDNIWWNFGKRTI